MALVGKAIYSELQSIANGIGKFYNGRYVKEEDALDCVKDLIKSLRRENETCDIRRFLGLAQVLQEDLIPLIINYGDEDEELFEVTIRCLMNLTQPARIVFKNEIPQDKTTRHCYIETESYLQNYKQSFVKEELLNVLSQKLAALLELNWEDRTEDQNVLIERMLVLLRNILHVPATDVDKLRTDDDASTHDQVIWHMHQTGLDKLILYVAASQDERRFCIHVLEIISLMFRDQTPEQLASAGASRSRKEKEWDEQELARVAEMEKAQKKGQLLKLATRHSRFGGTFVMKGTKSISEKDVIYHRSLTGLKEHTYDNGKKTRKKPKNRKPIDGDEKNRKSTLSIRVCLKEFCVEFIKNCYNPLMKSVKSALDRDSTQENDETYYLWSMRFFMQFQRLYHFDVELVRETMSVQEFHYVHTMILNHQDMMTMDKKEAITWGKRLHLALRTFRELLETLQAMATCPSSRVRDSAKVIQQNVFYVQEYRDMTVYLLQKFDNSRNSKLYARDLIETTHLYIKAMEKWCGAQGKVLVQKKKKRFVRRKKPQPELTPAEPPLTQEALENKWDDLSGELCELLQDLEEGENEVTPFDATSDVSIDDQRLECVRSLHEFLHSGSSAHAVALLRAAREVWPDNEEFGSVDISAEDEFMLLREVFIADIPRRPREEPSANPEDEDDTHGEIIEEEMEGVEEEVTQEHVFDLQQFLRTYSSQKVIRVYTLLLTQYRTNPVHTNHCIVKMLHRIAVQNGIVAFLFQLSLFRTFQKIFRDDCTKTPHFAEIKQFATYIICQFFKCAQKNPKVYVEMLFWKNARECFEVVEGYGSYKEQHAKAKSAVWTEEQEMELRQLYDEHKHSDGDIVDKILANLIDSSRSRRQVVRQLIIMDLVTDSKQLRKGISGRVVWSEQEVDQLRDLYEQHRDDQDPVGEIMVRMDKPRQQIVSKLVEIGVVEDRKLLRKGHKRKSHIRGSSDESSESEEEDSGPSHPFAGLTRGEPQELLTQLHEMPSMEYSLKWIQRSLNRAADDREDDDEEPVATPIIPLMEECEVALQDELFQRFLYTIGINPPLNEQEQFWRISLELDSQKLRQIANSMEKESRIECPELEFNYNIPSADAVRPKKPKKQRDGAEKERRPRVPAEPSKAPISKEFISSDDNSSDSDDGSGNWWQRGPQTLQEPVPEERANSSLDSEMSDCESIDSPESDPNRSILEGQFTGLTRGEPQELLTQLHEMPSLEYSLKWIQRSLNRAADDREDDDEEPVATPIIPLIEECEVALQDDLFQRFLYTIGINPPLNEQEQYWRISLKLDVPTLRQLSNAMEKDSQVDFPHLFLTNNKPTTSKCLVQPARQKKAKSLRQSSKKKSSVKETRNSGKAPIKRGGVGHLRSRRKRSRRSASTSNSDKENKGDSSQSDEGDKTTSINAGQVDTSMSCDEELNKIPDFESFPAAALTQYGTDSSDSDDDHLTIARAVQTKRKSAVLSDDSD